MKKRSGFVSNSSSSSFVMIGIDVTKQFGFQLMEKLMQEHGYQKQTRWDCSTQQHFQDFMCGHRQYSFHNGEQDGVVGKVIGKRIISGTAESDIDNGCLSLEQINEIGKQVKQFTGIHDAKPLIYFGTRSC